MKVERQALQHQSGYPDEQRKRLGIHYTPDAIVEYIVRRTLRPYVETNHLERLRNLTIVDPACGSGLFLLKAFDVLCSVWKQHLGLLRAEDARYILEHNLYGVDVDASAVRAAKEHLLKKAGDVGAEFVDLEPAIRQGDALMRPASSPQLKLPFRIDESDESFDWPREFPRVFAQGGFDCVIGNPPYVRIQRVQPPERRARYVELYETARGRFDIAGLFIELANRITKSGGRIGYIVSNKLLSTNGANHLRNYILTHYTLIEIVDPTDTKLFGAAVLPMILIAEKRSGAEQSFVHASIQEVNHPRPSPRSVENLLSPLEQHDAPLRMDVEWKGRQFRIEKFKTPPPSPRERVWAFHYPTRRRLVEKLRGRAAASLESIARKISVGLKTTADNVFIKPMTLEFVRQLKLEQELVFPVLESHNIQRWTYDWEPERDLYVLYPHQERQGQVVPVRLQDYPQAQRYLTSRRDQLEARTYLKESGRQWYEIWVHQSPKDFQQLKLITPDIASSNRFALDDRKFFVNGTCFYIILKDQSLEYNLLMLALLNSKVLEFFHKVTSGNVLYAKRFRYWTPYLKPYPIPDLSSPVIDKIIEHTRRLVEVADECERRTLEGENDRLVYQLFGLTDRDVDELETTLALQRFSFVCAGGLPRPNWGGHGEPPLPPSPTCPSI